MVGKMLCREQRHRVRLKFGFCPRHREEFIAACPQAVPAICPLSRSLPCLLLLPVFSRNIWGHVSGLDILPSVLHLTTLAPLPFPRMPDFRSKPKSRLFQISSFLSRFSPASCPTLFTPQLAFLQTEAQQQPAAEIVRKVLFDQLWAGIC